MTRDLRRWMMLVERSGRLAEAAASYTPPTLDIGDDVLIGKFKNRKAKVSGFTKDDHHQPVLKTTKGDQKLFKPRIVKLDVSETLEPSDTPLPTLYHGSRRRFRRGFVLLPQSDGYTEWDEVRLHEAFIERYRPRTYLPRSHSVFMIDDPKLAEFAGGYEDYVYEVRPQGKVEKNDLEWYSELDGLDGYSVADQEEIDLNDPDWIAAAKNYWRGVPHPGRSLFEYRSPSAIIVRRIKL